MSDDLVDRLLARGYSREGAVAVVRRLVRLQEARRGAFNPALHPRDRLQRFRDTPDRPKPTAAYDLDAARAAARAREEAAKAELKQLKVSQKETDSLNGNKVYMNGEHVGWIRKYVSTQHITNRKVNISIGVSRVTYYEVRDAAGKKIDYMLSSQRMAKEKLLAHIQKEGVAAPRKSWDEIKAEAQAKKAAKAEPDAVELANAERSPEVLAALARAQARKDAAEKPEPVVPPAKLSKLEQKAEAFRAEREHTVAYLRRLHERGFTGMNKWQRENAIHERRDAERTLKRLDDQIFMLAVKLKRDDSAGGIGGDGTYVVSAADTGEPLGRIAKSVKRYNLKTAFSVTSWTPTTAGGEKLGPEDTRVDAVRALLAHKGAQPIPPTGSAAEPPDASLKAHRALLRADRKERAEAAAAKKEADAVARSAKLAAEIIASSRPIPPSGSAVPPKPSRLVPTKAKFHAVLVSGKLGTLKDSELDAAREEAAGIARGFMDAGDRKREDEWWERMHDVEEEKERRRVAKLSWSERDGEERERAAGRERFNREGDWRPGDPIDPTGSAVPPGERSAEVTAALQRARERAAAANTSDDGLDKRDLDQLRAAAAWRAEVEASNARQSVVPPRGTKRTYFAFGKLRTTEENYPFASQDSKGQVRFHTSYAAAKRRGEVTPTELATKEHRAEAKRWKAGEAARAAERDAEFERRMSLTPEQRDAEQLAALRDAARREREEREAKQRAEAAQREKDRYAPQRAAVQALSEKARQLRADVEAGRSVDYEAQSDDVLEFAKDEFELAMSAATGEKRRALARGLESIQWAREQRGEPTEFDRERAARVLRGAGWEDNDFGDWYPPGSRTGDEDEDRFSALELADAFEEATGQSIKAYMDDHPEPFKMRPLGPGGRRSRRRNIMEQ